MMMGVVMMQGPGNNDSDYFPSNQVSNQLVPCKVLRRSTSTYAYVRDQSIMTEILDLDPAVCMSARQNRPTQAFKSPAAIEKLHIQLRFILFGFGNYTCGFSVISLHKRLRRTRLSPFSGYLGFFLLPDHEDLNRSKIFWNFARIFFQKYCNERYICSMRKRAGCGFGRSRLVRRSKN